jgi:hypothetical protein
VNTDPAIVDCHVPAGSADLQNTECACTTETCGAGLLNAAGAVQACAAAHRRALASRASWRLEQDVWPRRLRPRRRVWSHIVGFAVDAGWR